MEECFQMFSQAIMGWEKHFLIGDDWTVFQLLLCTIAVLMYQAKSMIAAETRKPVFYALKSSCSTDY